MSDAWDDRKRAQEEEYFHTQNKAALERLKEKAGRQLPSPITGEPMETIAFRGVLIDRCPKSGGVWLDAGELEQILDNFEKQDKRDSAFDFLKGLFSPKLVSP